MANLSQCKTEDSRKHLEIESSLPRVAMDRGFFACGTDADLVTNAMLIQNFTARWKAVRCPRETPEPHAVSRVLEPRHEWLGQSVVRGFWGLPPRHSLTQFGSDEVKDNGRDEFEVFASVKWCG